MESLKIKSLCVICKFSYPHIVASLTSVSDSTDEEPLEKKIKLQQTNEEIKNAAVASVQDELQKMGVYGDYLRELLWKEFDRVGVTNKRPDVYTYLEAILNQSISSLVFFPDHFKKPHEPFTLQKKDPGCDVLKLMAIIDRKCPFLQSLSLVVPNSNSLRDDAVCCLRPFLSLSKLTKLELIWPSSTNFKEFFLEVGTACPGLKHLKMGNNRNKSQFELKELVSLVLGQKAELLKNSFWQKINGARIHSLQFDENLLTPICKSLQFLEVNSGVKMVFTPQSITSTAAFLLRHIPLLERLSVRLHIGRFVASTSLAVQLLHHQLLEPKEIVNVSEVTSKEDGKGNFVHIKLTINSPPRTLNLTNLSGSMGSMNVRNSEGLSAISFMCPRLNAIQFREAHIQTSQQMFVFNKFTKLRAVTFGDLSPEYCEALVAALGDQLLSVTWKTDNDLSLLAPCAHLEELIVKSVSDTPMRTPFLTENFLPGLEKLITNRCLFSFGRTFETVRPSLTEVQLNCAHFDCDEVSVCKWEDLPHLWPNLQHFSLYQHNQYLELDDMCKIFPHLKKLKSLVLPIEITEDCGGTEEVVEEGDLIIKGYKSDEEARDVLLDQFWKMPSPIQLKFQEDFHYYPCDFC